VCIPSRSVPGVSDDSEVVRSSRLDAHSDDSAEPRELRAQSEACGSLAAGVGTGTCTQASLTVEVRGSGTVTSSPAGITCPGTCTAAFPLDSTVVLTAAPGAGATTVTWTWDAASIGCSNAASTTCSVALDTNTTVTATFQ
jgi:hypothetical protein